MIKFLKKATAAILLAAGVILATPASNAYANTDVVLLSNSTQSTTTTSGSLDAAFLRFHTGTETNLVTTRFIVKFKFNPEDDLSAMLCKGNPVGTDYCASNRLDAGEFALSKSVSGKNVTFTLPDGGKILDPDSGYYLRIDNAHVDTGLTSSSSTIVARTGWRMKSAKGLYSGSIADINGTHYGIMAVEGYIMSTSKITGISITSTPENEGTKTYTRGEVIKFQVTSDNNLEECTTAHSDNCPNPTTLKIKFRSTEDRYIPLHSIVGNKVNFHYTVQEDDVDADGLWVPVDPLRRSNYLRTVGQGGYLDRKGKNTSQYAYGHHPDHKVDGSQVIPLPAISEINVTSRPKRRPNTYLLGDVISFTVKFDKPINVDGTPQFQFNLGSGVANHRFAAADIPEGLEGTNALVFRYTVQTGDRDNDGIWIPENPVKLPETTDKIYDAVRPNKVAANLNFDSIGRQANHKINGDAEENYPKLDSIAFKTSSQVDYYINDSIEVIATYSERVVIVGSPYINILVGPNTTETERRAYFTGNFVDVEQKKPIFRYRVQAGDADIDDIRIKLTPSGQTAPSVIHLSDGESITSFANSNDAELYEIGTFVTSEKNIIETVDAKIKLSLSADNLVIHENGTATFRVNVETPSTLTCSGNKSVKFRLGASTGVITGTNADLKWNDDSEIGSITVPCEGKSLTIKAPVNDANEGIETVTLRMVEVGTDFIVDPARSSVEVTIYEADYNVSVNGNTTGIAFRWHENEPDTHTIEILVKNSSGDLVPVPEDTQFRLRFLQTREAEAGQDYDSFPNNGVFTIPKGGTGLTVSVPIIDDDDVEKYEHFDIRIETPVGVTQTATVVNAIYKVRLYSEEIALIGMENHEISVNEGESAEVCLVFKIVDNSYQDDPAYDSNTVDDYNFVIGDTDRERKYLKPNGRIGFPFQLSLSPLKGSASLGEYDPNDDRNDNDDPTKADDYVDIDPRETFIPKGTRHNGRICRQVQILSDTIVEDDESFRVIVERLPGVNSYVEIEFDVENDPNPNPHFRITIKDVGNTGAFGRFDVTANVSRPGKIDVSWGHHHNTDGVRTATHYKLYHRQLPFGCKMEWTIPDMDFPTHRKYNIKDWPTYPEGDPPAAIDEICPYTIGTYQSNDKTADPLVNHTAQVRSNAHSGGVIQKVELKVEAYKDTMLLDRTEPVFVDPRLTHKVGCAYYIGNRDNIVNVEGEDTEEISYFVNTRSNEECIGGIKITPGRERIDMDWHPVSSAGNYGGNTSRSPYYRVEWKESGKSEWQSAIIRNNGTSKRVNFVETFRVRHSIENLIQGKAYDVRVVTLGVEETPTEIFKKQLLPERGEEIYRITSDKSHYFLDEGKTLALICVRFSRIDGEKISSKDLPNGKAIFTIKAVEGTAIQTVTGSVDGDYFKFSDTLEFPRSATECRALFVDNDLEYDPDEQLTVEVRLKEQSPKLGHIASLSIPVTIIDNDGFRLALKKENGNDVQTTVTEGLGEQKICATLESNDRATTTTMDIPVRIDISGTAERAKDYTIKDKDGNTNLVPPLNLTIPQGQSKACFKFNTVNGNYEVEWNETVKIDLRHNFPSSTTNIPEPLEPVSKTITIKDNDVVEMKIKETNYSMDEGDGTLTFKVAMESANTNTNCLIDFPVYFRIVSTPHTAKFKENPSPDSTNTNLSNKGLPPNADIPRWELDNSHNRNADLPEDRVDGYYFDEIVKMERCATEATVTWEINDDPYVERQTEQFFVAIHPINNHVDPTKNNPAGLRVNSRSRFDISDNDISTVSFVGEKDADDITHYVPVGTTTVEVPYNLTNGVEFQFRVGLETDNDKATLDNTENLSGRNLTIHPYTHYGDQTGIITVDLADDLSEGTVITLTMDASLLRFQDSIQVPDPIVKIKIGERPTDIGPNSLTPNLRGDDNNPGGRTGNSPTCDVNVITTFTDENGDTVDIANLQMEYFTIENGTAQSLTKAENGEWTLGVRSTPNFTGLIRVILNAKENRWTIGEQVFRALTPQNCLPANANELNNFEIKDQIIDPEFHPNTIEYTLETDNQNEITINASTVYNTSTVEITPTDTNTDIEGHQVTLVNGENTIQAIVTTLAGEERTYTLTVTNNVVLPQTETGPITVSVEDEEAVEGVDPSLDFKIKLSRAATSPITIYYDTIGNTATADVDFKITKGTFTFNIGETEKIIKVPVIDDNIDEGKENMVFLVVNITEQISLQATGTIINSDPLPKAWIARHGHILTGQVTETIWKRIDRSDNNFVNLAGNEINLDKNSSPDEEDILPEDNLKDTSLKDIFKEKQDSQQPQPESLMVVGDLFQITNFDKTFSMWGEFARNNFESEVDSTRLSGSVDTVFVGADVGNEKELIGVVVGHSTGRGTGILETENNNSESKLVSEITTIHPFYKTSFDLYDVWIAAGYGKGNLQITEKAKEKIKTKLDMYDAILGLRRNLTQQDNFTLDIRSDAFIQKISSDKANGVEASEAITHRFRVLLDAEYNIDLNGASIVPRISTGFRHDGGDIEKTKGIEINIGLKYTTPNFEFDGEISKFFADNNYEEWGFSNSISYRQKENKGAYATYSQTYGNIDRSHELWKNDISTPLHNNGDIEKTINHNLEIGYKFSGAIAESDTTTPYYKTDIENNWSAGLIWSDKNISLDIKYEEQVENKSIFAKFKLRF